MVSISMNLSSNFGESCPSNVGISGSMVVVRLDSLCVVHTVSMVCQHRLVHWFYTGLGGWLEHHGEMLQLISEM